MPNEDNETDFVEMLRLTDEGRMALAMGDAVVALNLLHRKHELVLRNFGENSVFAATSGVDLGEAHLACGSFQEASRILQWSLLRYQELNVDDDRTLRAQSGVATAAYQSADYETAEQRFRAMIADLESRGEEFEIRCAVEKDHLAQVLHRQNRFTEAEEFLLEALAVFEEKMPGEADTAVCLSFLGKVYFRMARYREAEAVGRRALATFTDFYGEDSVDVAKSLDHLAMSLAMRAQTEGSKILAEEAISLGERSVKIFTASLPPTHRSVFASYENLKRYKNMASSIGMMYPIQSSEQMESPVEPNSPPNHPDAIVRRVSTAFETAMNRDYAAAIAQIREVTADSVNIFGYENPLTYHARGAHIQILRRNCTYLLGEPTGILSSFESMNMQLRAHMRRGVADDENTKLPSLSSNIFTKVKEIINEALEIIDNLITESISPDGFRKTGAALISWSNGGYVGDVLELLHYARLIGALSSTDACDKANLVMQLHGWNSVVEVFEATLMRNQSTPELQAIQEEYHSLKLEYDALVDQLVERAIGRAQDKASNEISDELSRIQLRIKELRNHIESSSTEPDETLLANKIYSLLAIQSFLRENEEAVISYHVGSRAVFIVAITGVRHKFIRVEYESGLVGALCDSFRKSVEFDPSTGSAPSFKAYEALRLYDLLIQPLENYLDRITHLLLIPDGPLWTISFEALIYDLEAVEEIASANQNVNPDIEENDEEGIAKRSQRIFRARTLSERDDVCTLISRADAWLGSRYAVSVLPAVGVLGARRMGNLEGKQPTKYFLGFGNPLFPSVSAPQNSAPETNLHSEVIRGVDTLVPLPQTERLLYEIGKVLGADIESDIIVREEASLQRVLELDNEGELANRGIICFATHALYPTKDGDPLQEPGLVLAVNDKDEATVLFASQISQLRLNADLIMLTACFTAAPEGKSINTPLSGLAQAFFSAGAKCILVTHWSVDVYATEALILEMFSGINENESLSHALQRAARTIRRDSSRPDFAHPVYWAGFSIIGDGGVSVWSV